MTPHEVVAWTGVAIAIGVVVGALIAATEQWALGVWRAGECLRRLGARWRAWRLRRGFVAIEGSTPGESQYARLRELMRR